MEHRHGHRVGVKLNVLIAMHRRQYGTGQTVNISRSGVLIRTPMAIPLFARAHLRFVTREGNVSHVRMLDGQVVRLDHGAVAFEWSQPDSRKIAALLANTARLRQSTSATPDWEREAGPRR